MSRDLETKRIETEIYNIVCKELSITKTDQKLVDDALNNSIGLSRRYKHSGAEKPINAKMDLKTCSYCNIEYVNTFINFQN